MAYDYIEDDVADDFQIYPYWNVNESGHSGSGLHRDDFQIYPYWNVNPAAAANTERHTISFKSIHIGM